MKKNSQLRSEFVLFKRILQFCSTDLLLGYKASGAGTAVPNLTYLATCLLIEVGGTDTLKDYKGIGPNNKNLAKSSSYLDGLITNFKKDIVSGEAGYKKLQEIEERVKDVLKRSGLNSLMSKFLAGSESAEETEKDEEDPGDREILYFTSTDDDDDNDDKPSPAKPKPPTKGRKRRAGRLFFK